MKLKLLILLCLTIFFAANTAKAQSCPSGQTEIDFVVIGANGGFSNYILLQETTGGSSYFLNTISVIECIGDGLCYTVTIAGNAGFEVYQDGVLVSNPVDGDVICFPFVNSTYGCTDGSACNYDASANVDDGSCDLPSGCGDPLYLEYSSSVTCSDANACITLIVNGCIDMTACNYNALANVDDGSCDLPYGCGDPLYLEYNSLVTCSDANACLTLLSSLVYGCMDPLADNYNPLATFDDGSCTYTYGCMDPLADNYNPLATFDDGSCTYTLVVYGCLDTAACNYDPYANTDDGNCYHNILASIIQDGDNLIAATTPVGLNADWYNIQTEDTTNRTWLMKEDASLFTPTFECTYYIEVDGGNCNVTSDTYYFGATAKRIGSLIVSPNPTTSQINIKFENEKNQYVYLHLMNSNGVKLDNFMTKNTKLDIDISKYPSGAYYLYFDGADSKQGCNPEDIEMISTKIILNK